GDGIVLADESIQPKALLAIGGAGAGAKAQGRANGRPLGAARFPPTSLDERLSGRSGVRRAPHVGNGTSALPCVPRSPRLGAFGGGAGRRELDRPRSNRQGLPSCTGGCSRDR